MPFCCCWPFPLIPLHLKSSPLLTHTTQQLHDCRFSVRWQQLLRWTRLSSLRGLMMSCLPQSFLRHISPPKSSRLMSKFKHSSLIFRLIFCTSFLQRIVTLGSTLCSVRQRFQFHSQKKLIHFPVHFPHISPQELPWVLQPNPFEPWLFPQHP